MKKYGNCFEVGPFEQYSRKVYTTEQGLRSNQATALAFDKKGVLFLREWISFVIKESKMDKTMLNFIYQQLSLLYRINMTGEIGNYLLLHRKY